MKGKRRFPKRKITVPKDCYFCKEEKTPWYSDVASLQRFVTERGKIIARANVPGEYTAFSELSGPGHQAGQDF